MEEAIHVGAGGIWDIFVLTAQFCYESKTGLKITFINKKNSLVIQTTICIIVVDIFVYLTMSSFVPTLLCRCMFVRSGF